jgi:hypothetical protein
MALIGGLRRIVGIPAASRNEDDHDLHLIRLDRRLATATAHPSDYGLVPETLAAAAVAGTTRRSATGPSSGPERWTSAEESRRSSRSAPRETARGTARPTVVRWARRHACPAGVGEAVA